MLGVAIFSLLLAPTQSRLTGDHSRRAKITFDMSRSKCIFLMRRLRKRMMARGNSIDRSRWDRTRRWNGKKKKKVAVDFNAVRGLLFGKDDFFIISIAKDDIEIDFCWIVMSIYASLFLYTLLRVRQCRNSISKSSERWIRIQWGEIKYLRSLTIG